MNTLLNRLSDNNPEQDVDNEEGEDKSSTLLDELLLLLSSRPRSELAENMVLINASVMNYGIRDTFPCDTLGQMRHSIMQKRIELSLLRFEPRLKNTQVYSDNQEGHTHSFVIEADTDTGPVCYRLMWDDILSHFSLRE